MPTTDNILAYATHASIPTSWHARLSFWNAVIWFPTMIFVGFMGWFARIGYLPMTKLGVLQLCLQTFVCFFGPLSSIVYGISAIVRIWTHPHELQGQRIAWAGIVLGLFDFFTLAAVSPTY